MEFDTDSSIALLWAARSVRFRVPLVAVSALFLGAHAVLHIYDTLRGYLDHTHWWLDFPGVYLPAILTGWAWFALERQDRAGETV